MDIVIREFQAADAAALFQLSGRLTEGTSPWRDAAQVASVVRGWVAEAIQNADPDRQPVFVAEQDGALIGFVCCSTQQHWSGQCDGYVGELVVDARHEDVSLCKALPARHTG